MSASGSCPSCGSPLSFRAATTITTVCPACRSIVARGGVALELVGRTNEVLVSASALQLGLEASHQGRRFTIIGRSQLRHALGGVWDEWLVRFDDDRLAWLAEHQGRLSLLAEANVHDAPHLASPADAEPGQSYLSPIGELIVSERGEAELLAEQGELPTRTLPGARRPFVDFTSRDGRCATLDFGALETNGTRAPKRFFVGRELTLADLGLQAVTAPPPLPRVEGATAFKCPRCAAPVATPRTGTESISCRYCNAVLSVDDQSLAVLFAQNRLAHTPAIPLGTAAALDLGFFTRASGLGKQPRPWPTQLQVEVVAHLVRSVVVDGVRYFFQEHLLEAQGGGFFWLVESDGKWLFVRNLDAGLVELQGRQARLEQRTFNFEQQVEARVEQVLGELYWRVHLHDAADLTDYRNTPRTLSREKTDNELIWTECLDIPRAEVERTFGIVAPPVPGYEGGSPSSTSDRQGGVVATLLLLFALIFGIAQCFSEEDPAGGSRGSSTSGSGFSFGK